MQQMTGHSKPSRKPKDKAKEAAVKEATLAIQASAREAVTAKEAAAREVRYG